MDFIVIARSLQSLNARRKQLDENEKGFTLIELLVVVIIIGILAAIAIPVYLGIQDNAKNSAVKSDLTNAKTAVVAFYTATPDATAGPALDTGLAAYGFSATDGVTLTYGTEPTTAGSTFCITGTRDGTTTSFHVSDSTGVEDGDCVTTP